jgi:carboxymethylenebutenolidase
MSRIDIKTRDGTCPSYAYLPAGDGPWPAVPVFMHGLGMRSAIP